MSKLPKELQEKRVLISGHYYPTELKDENYESKRTCGYKESDVLAFLEKQQRKIKLLKESICNSKCPHDCRKCHIREKIDKAFKDSKEKKP